MAPLFVLSEHYRSADKSGVREYSGGKAASVSLRILFLTHASKLWLHCSHSAGALKMLVIEPRVHCRALPSVWMAFLFLDLRSRTRLLGLGSRCTPMYPAYEGFHCRALHGRCLRQLRCLRVPAHFLLAVPKAAMLRIAAVCRRQNACDRTRLLGLGSRCTTDVRILRCMDPAWSSWIS